MDIEKLIFLVQERSFIYDKSRSDFKNGMKKYYAWQEIAAELGVTMTEAQSKWKLLREKYGKEKRIIQRSCDSGESSRGEWEFYRLLKFLDPHIIGRRSASTFEPPSQFPVICQSQMSDSQGSVEYTALELEDAENDDDEHKDSTSFSHTYLPSTPCSFEVQQKLQTSPAFLLPSNDSGSRKRKSNVEDMFINSLNHLTSAVAQKVSKEMHTNDESDDSHFGKDIIAELGKMKNLKKKRQLKAKIYALICEYDSD